VSHTTTTWVTVLVALHRYIAVCKAHHLKRFGSRKVAKIQLGGVFIFAVLFNLPRFLQYTVVQHKDRPLTIEPRLAGELFDHMYLVGAYQVVI